MPESIVVFKLLENEVVSSFLYITFDNICSLLLASLSFFKFIYAFVVSSIFCRSWLIIPSFDVSSSLYYVLSSMIVSYHFILLYFLITFLIRSTLYIHLVSFLTTPVVYHPNQSLSLILHRTH